MMFVGMLQFELLVRSSTSLKDKRRVVKSLKDRLHREHLCAVAEVDATEHQRLAVVGVSVVSGSATRASAVLDSIASKLSSVRDGEVGALTRMVCSMESLRPNEVDEFGDPVLPVGEAASLEAELLARGNAAATEADRAELGGGGDERGAA